MSQKIQLRWVGEAFPSSHSPSSPHSCLEPHDAVRRVRILSVRTISLHTKWKYRESVTKNSKHGNS